MLTNTMRRPEFQELVNRMTGTFSSHQQSLEKPTYHDVEMDLVQIKPQASDEDEQWFYIEQKLAGSKPYRQRVYHLIDEGDHFRNEIYLIPDQERYVGNQNLDELAGAELNLKGGCDVILTLDDNGNYVGGTQGTSCPSVQNGASYATTEIEIRNDGLTSKDQGFNDQGYLRWGVAGDGYIFDRIS